MQGAQQVITPVNKNKQKSPRIYLTPKQIYVLRQKFGHFETAGELMQRLEKANSISIQGEPLWLSDAGVRKLKQQALRHRISSDPRPDEATEAQLAEIVRRYINKVIFAQIKSALGVV